MASDPIESISSKTQAIWALLTIGGSILAAVISATIYVNGLINEVHALADKTRDLDGQVSSLRTQLMVVSPREPNKLMFYNGGSTPQCDPGSFVAGLSIGNDDKSNPRGILLCAKVQPAVK